MPADDHPKTSITELTLQELGVPDFGWVADRPKLSENALLDMTAELARKLPAEQALRVIQALKFGFSNAVEIALHNVGFLKEIDDWVERTGRKKRSPRKLGVVLRDYIQELISVFGRVEQGEIRLSTRAFIADIERVEVLDRMVTIELEAEFGFNVIDPLRNAPDRSAEGLPGILARLEQEISSGIKRGPPFSEHRYLAECVVHTLTCETGQIPGRTWDEYAECDQETGLGLELCRILASELLTYLPQKHRKKAAVDMVTPYRKAIKRAHEEMG